jgi:hypothetical protein
VLSVIGDGYCAVGGGAETGGAETGGAACARSGAAGEKASIASAHAHHAARTGGRPRGAPSCPRAVPITAPRDRLVS